MSRFALILATFLVVAGIPLAGLATVDAQTVPTPTLSVTVFGETVGSRQVFAPDQILIPQVPIQLVVTFHNNDTVMDHSFTMNDVNGTVHPNTGSLAPGQNATVTLTVITMTQVSFNGTTYTPEAGPSGILFYCIPHRGTGIVGQGMVGQIILASAPVPTTVPEKGILLRAYWIGIIGIVAMLVWTGITYYIIKSSSRHFVNQAEHVRRGLP